MNQTSAACYARDTVCGGCNSQGDRLQLQGHHDTDSIDTKGNVLLREKEEVIIDCLKSEVMISSCFLDSVSLIVALQQGIVHCNMLLFVMSGKIWL